MDYMAPEQISGEQVTPATDVYLLGCLMYECVSGKPPFAHTQGMRVLWAHLQDPAANSCAARDDAPEGLGSAILRELEKDPAGRPSGAIAYAQMLAAAAAR
jgi:serine/threonine protein kinase